VHANHMRWILSALLIALLIVGGAVSERDIRNHERDVEALTDSEERFRTLANAIPQLCWMTNANGWIFWYNQRWYEFTGTTPHEMEGSGWTSVHDPQGLPVVLEDWKHSIAAGEPFEMDFPLQSADGVFHPFLIATGAASGPYRHIRVEPENRLEPEDPGVGGNVWSDVWRLCGKPEYLDGSRLSPGPRSGGATLAGGHGDRQL
jgi:PAS domain S-box-containing protein